MVNWGTCLICNENFVGAVKLALGWACWKTYLGPEETETERGTIRSVSIGILGEALQDTDPELALSVLRAQTTLYQKARPTNLKGLVLMNQGKEAFCYSKMGQYDQALRLRRVVHAGFLELYGPAHHQTISHGNQLLLSLADNNLYSEAKLFARQLVRATPEPPVDVRAFVAVRVVAADTLCSRTSIGDSQVDALIPSASTSRAEMVEVVELLEDASRMARQRLGCYHQLTGVAVGKLEHARAALAGMDS